MKKKLTTSQLINQALNPFKNSIEEEETGLTILSIDPGPVKTAWAVLNTASPNKIFSFGIEENETFLTKIVQFVNLDYFVYEMIASYGMPVGATTFDTCVWIGRFIQQVVEYQNSASIHPLFRKTVCSAICGSSRAKDANIRQALIDRYGPVGTKANKGVLYGASKDMWSAIAIATTMDDILKGVYEYQL